MIVKALKIPVRYKGVTHPSGQFFDMEEEHFNEKIVSEATLEEEENMAKYSKGADRTRKPAEAKEEVKAEATAVTKEPAAAETPTEANDYSTFTEAELKKVKNDDLTAYLDSKGIEYKADAIKEDYINAILGK